MITSGVIRGIEHSGYAAHKGTVLKQTFRGIETAVSVALLAVGLFAFLGFLPLSPAATYGCLIGGGAWAIGNVIALVVLFVLSRKKPLAPPDPDPAPRPNPVPYRPISQPRPQPRRQPNVRNNQPPPKPPEPIYPPLAQWMEQRKKNDDLHIPNVVPLDRTSLGRVENALGTPEGEIDHHKLRDFQQKMRETYKGLLNGSVTLLVGDQEQTINVSVHPHLMPFARGMIGRQIENFNQLLDGLRPIDCNKFFEEFQDIEKYCQTWGLLLAKAHKTSLSLDDLRELNAAFVPKSTSVFDEYLIIKKNSKYLWEFVGSIPVAGGVDPQTLFKIAGKFNTLLGSSVNFLTREQQFLTELLTGFAKLFQNTDDNAELTLADVEQILKYIEEETKKVPYEVSEIYQQISSDTQKLTNPWKLMQELVHGPDNIDTKIELLAQIAETLPDASDDIWKRYPLMKDGMGKTLMPLTFKYFSNYRFDVVLTTHNQEKFEADQLRKVQIDTAFEQMAHKLGCQQPKLPEIEMDTSPDAGIQAQERENLIQQLVAEVNLINQTFRNDPPQLRGAQAAQLLILRLPGQHQLIQEVLHRLNNPPLANVINLALEPYE